MGYTFIKGMVLAERLYHEGVKPVMAHPAAGIELTPTWA